IAPPFNAARPRDPGGHQARRRNDRFLLVHLRTWPSRRTRLRMGSPVALAAAREGPMNVLALCAGVGGLELGIRIAEPGSRGICYIEREAYAAAILAARMEDG